MTPRTDFYLLKQIDESARLLTVCRIVEKAYLKSHHIYIFCENEKQTETLDKLLWTFHDTSFIPHQCLLPSAKPDLLPPVLIGHSVFSTQFPHDILVNLTSHVPDFFNTFQRIMEVIPENAEQRENARAKYRFYQKHRCELYSHTL